MFKTLFKRGKEKKKGGHSSEAHIETSSLHKKKAQKQIIKKICHVNVLTLVNEHRETESNYTTVRVYMYLCATLLTRRENEKGGREEIGGKKTIAEKREQLVELCKSSPIVLASIFFFTFLLFSYCYSNYLSSLRVLDDTGDPKPANPNIHMPQQKTIINFCIIDEIDIAHVDEEKKKEKRNYTF